MAYRRATCQYVVFTVSIYAIRYEKYSVLLCNDTLSDADRPLIDGSCERYFNDKPDEIYYTSSDLSLKRYRHPRPLNSSTLSASRYFTDHQFTALEIRGKVATLRLTGQDSERIEQISKQGFHEMCNLVVPDDRNRVTSTVIVDGRLVLHLHSRMYQLLTLCLVHKF